MRRRRGYRRPQIRFGEHIVDGIVNNHHIKGASQPHGAHIAQVMGRIRVEPLRYFQHRRGNVHRLSGEMPRQMRQQMPAAASQLQQRGPAVPAFRNGKPTADNLQPFRRLDNVLLRRADYGPQVGQVIVQTHRPQAVRPL